MRPFLLLAIIAIIIFLGIKFFYKPVVGFPASTPAKAVEPPIVSKPLTPILSPEETEKVIAATRDMNPNVRWQALQYLVQTKAPQADSILFEMLQQDSDAGVRRNIVSMLGDRPGSKATQYLIKALQDQEPSVRITALQMLDKRGDFSAGPAISELLHDIDEHVRLEAISTLNSLQTKHDAEVRRQQEEALRQQKEQQRLSGGGK